MIEHISIKNFKSIKDANINLPYFGGIVGQNAAGKTNLIQAINFVKSLVAGKRPNTSREVQLGIIPQELFNFNEQGTTLFISITLKDSNDTKYILETEVKLLNGSVKIPTLNVAQEKLKKITSNEESTLIYVRNQNGLVDKNNSTIPLAVDPDKLVLAIYSDPDVITVKKMFSNILIPDIETINSRESLVSGVDDELGLASTLVKLMHGDSQSYSNFTKIVKKIMPAFVSVVETSATEASANTPDKEKTYMILLEEKDLAGKLSMQSVSSGDLRTLFLIATAISMPTNSSLFIEEIENGLHPRRVLDVIEYLKSIGIKKEVQILFTTHSPKVINSLSIKEVLFVEKSSNKGTRFLLLNECDQNTQIQKLLNKGGQITDYLNLSFT